jgi:hypothetical protein
MVWVDSYFGIPVVLLTLLLIMINVMSLFHSQKSNKVGEKKFLRLQCVEMEEQAKGKVGRGIQNVEAFRCFQS